MFKSRKKLWLICSIFFSLFLISGCSVKIVKDAEPSFNIYKVDNEKDDKGEKNK